MKTKLTRHAGASVFVALSLAALGGCQKQEGPAERAGRELDQAVQKAGQQMEKAGQDIQKAANDAKK